MNHTVMPEDITIQHTLKYFFTVMMINLNELVDSEDPSLHVRHREGFGG